MIYNKLGKPVSPYQALLRGLTVGPARRDERAGGEVIAYAFSKGINFIDTAQLYCTYPHIKYALKSTARTGLWSHRKHMFEAGTAERRLNR